MEYSFLKSVVKGLRYAVIFAVPVLLAHHAGWQELTVSGVLTIIYDWAKNGLGNTQSLAMFSKLP